MPANQQRIFTPDVLVVGAGVTGAPLALGLHQKGYDVLLVDRAAAVKRVFKAEYMQPAPLNSLKKMGFASIFKTDKFSPINELHFRDLGENNQDVISDISMAYPQGYHAVTFTHDSLVNGLRAVATQSMGEKVMLGYNLVPTNLSDPYFFERPEFELRSENNEKIVVRPKWVVGCDGRHSSVREWMRGPKAPRNTKVIWGANPELIIGAEVATPAPQKNTYQVVRSFQRGTLFAFNLPGVGQRIYFSTLDKSGNGKEQWQNDISSLLEHVNKFEQIGVLDAHAPIVGCPAYQTFFGPAARGRFLLCGDAVGVTTPYGGQGISLGIEHVEHLIENFEWRAQSQLISSLSRREYSLTVENAHSRLDIVNWSLYFLFFARSPLSKLTTQHVVNSWHHNPEIPEKVMTLFGGISRERPSIPEIFDIWGLQKGRRSKLLSLLRPALARRVQRVDSNF